MKKVLFIIITIFIVLPTLAQGWEWGRSDRHGISEGLCAATDKWGNVYGAGYTFANDTMVFGMDTLLAEMFLIKYDSLGNYLWGTGASTAAPISIATDPWGNVYILALNDNYAVGIGDTLLENTGVPDTLSQYFLAKFAPDGHFLWATNVGDVKMRRDFLQTNFGHYIYYNNLGAMAIDNKGSVYITCNYNNNPTIGTFHLNNLGGTDIFLAKFDTLGNVIWAQGISGSDKDLAMGLSITPDKHIYLTGETKSSNLSFNGGDVIDGSDAASGDLHTFIARFDLDGHEIWVRHSDVSFSVSVQHCAADNAGSIYISGILGVLAFGNDTAYCPIGAFVGGFLLKLDSSGKVAWLKNIMSDSNVMAFGITTDPCNNVWVNGFHSGDLFLDSYHLVMDSIHADNLFLIGYTSAGHLIEATSIASGGDDFCDMVCDYKGNIFLCGDVAAPVYLPCGDSLIPTYENVFIAKYRHKLGIDTMDLHQVVCLGDSLLLKAPSGFDTYLWNTGATSDRLMVHNAGTDIVVGHGLCIYLADTFKVINNPPSDSSSMLSDSFLCTNSSLLLQSSTGFTNYYWNTSNTDTVLPIGDTGIYWVLCKSGKGCDALVHIDSFKIKDGSKNLHFSLAPDTVACAAFYYYLPNNGVSYIWQDSSTANTFLVAQSGVYSFIASQYGCTFRDSLSVIIPVATISPADTMACVEEFTQIKLQVHSPNAWQYTWNTGNTGNEQAVTNAGTYFVVRTFSVCVATDTFRVRTEACGIIVHDAITPNGDGINDTWVVEGIDKFPKNSVQVFDKWGNSLYQKSNYNNDWFGRQSNGESVPDGTYYYVVKLNALKLSEGEHDIFTGALLVKR